MNESIFLKACRGEAVERIPVWFMRQAGRSLPGYRAMREKYSVLEVTQNPELAAQVSIEPVNLLGVDAAILFADIMLLPIAMGIKLQIVDSVGPVIDKAFDDTEDIARLLPFEKQNVGFLAETIEQITSHVSVPVIGFSGAPFTLASYLIEGKPSRTWQKTKRFMLENPEGWHTLMATLSDAIIEYLKVQIEAGASAVQLFDSWVGCLSPAQYEIFVLPHVAHIFNGLQDQQVPRLHFGTNTAGILDLFSSVDCEVIGVDWRVRLKSAQKIIGNKSLQGNLDPAVLLGSWETLKKTVDLQLTEIDSKKGYIFNLGHGMPPEANDAMIRRLVEYVHTK